LFKLEALVAGKPWIMLDQAYNPPLKGEGFLVFLLAYLSPLQFNRPENELFLVDGIPYPS